MALSRSDILKQSVRVMEGLLNLKRMIYLSGGCFTVSVPGPRWVSPEVTVTMNQPRCQQRSEACVGPRFPSVTSLCSRHVYRYLPFTQNGYKINAVLCVTRFIFDALIGLKGILCVFLSDCTVTVTQTTTLLDLTHQVIRVHLPDGYWTRKHKWTFCKNLHLCIDLY